MINTKITYQSIYLIDPDTDTRNRLANALRELGRVHTSGTIGEFMTQHQQAVSGVVILAYALPAWETTVKQLKLKPNAPHIILLTPNDNRIISRALRAGVEDCVTIPVSSDLLRRRVGVLLTQAAFKSALNGHIESDESLNEESHYRDIFMSANDAIMVVDLLSSQFIDVNYKATRLFGYSYEEFKKLTINDLRDPDIPHLSGSSVYDELTTRGSFIFQQTYVTKAGERIPVEVSSRTLRYNGRSATLNFVRDVRMRVEMENAEREQRRMADALRDNASAINSTLELSEVIDRMLEQVTRVIQCDATNIMLIEGDQTRMIGHRGYEKFTPLSDELIHPGWKISEKENVRQVITTQKPFVLPNVSDYGGWIKVPSAAWVNSYLCVPIILDDTVIGLLNLDDSRVGKLHHGYVSNLVAFADQASIAIRNARLYEQVRTHAETLEKRVEERTAALQKINDELTVQMEENQRIAEELTEERTLLHTVIDNIPDDVYVKDVDGRFVLVNKSDRKHMKARIPGTALIGATDFDFSDEKTALQHQAEERAMFESGEPIINQEIIIDAGTPQERVILISKMVLHDSNGNVRGLVGINRDITEVRRADRQLVQERTLLRMVIDNIPDDVYVKDIEGHFILVNKSGERRMLEDQPSKSLIGSTDFDFLPEEVARKFFDAERAMYENGQPIINAEIIRNAGTSDEQVLLVTKMILRDGDGVVTGLVGINRDVTEVRRVDRQLVQERTLLRTVIDNIPDDVYVKDVEGRFVLVNKPLQDRLQTYLSEDANLIGTTNDLYMPPDRTIERNQIEHQIIETGEAIFNDEIEITLSDGKSHIQLATKVPLRDEAGKIIGVIGINRDITDTYETRRALEKERVLLRTLVDNIPDHVYVKDREGRFLLANRAALNNFNITEEDEILGKRDSEFLPEELSSSVYEQEQELMQNGETSMNMLHLSHTHSRWLMINKIPLLDQDGGVIGLIGVNRDVTDMREANQALEQERTMLRTLLDNLPDRIYIKDRESRFILVNQSVLDRRNEIEVIGKTDFDLDPDYVARPAYEIEQNLMETGEASINMLHRDHISDDWLLITKIPLKDQHNNVTGLIGINRNVTEVKQAQEQLQQLVEDLQGAEQRLQHVVGGARCLLWYAIVSKTGTGKEHNNLHWQMFVSSEEAAQQFLPVSMETDEDYVIAWQKSILMEDLALTRQQSAWAIFNGQTGYRQEFRCLRADGEIRWLAEETQITPLTEGRWNVVGICTDVTELKQAEMALRQTNEMLEARVAERTRELMRVNAEERSQRLLAEALSDTSAALSSSLELNDVLDRILSYAATVMPMHDMANILLIEGEDYVRVIRSREYAEDTGRFQTLSENTVFHLSKMPLLRTIVRTGESLTVRNTDNPQPWLPIASNNKPVKSYICAPINSGGKIIGFVSFASTQAYRFSATDTDRLIAFTNQAGIAISNARLFADVRDQANVLEQMVAERTVELENERSQLRTILNGMTEGVIYYDTANDVRYVNESLVKLTGYTEYEWQSASGMMLSLDLKEPERRNVLQTLMGEVAGQGTYRTELQMRTKDNRYFDASVIFSAVHGDGDDIVGHVVVMRDISQEKRLEAQKAHFIANASHELRTPITNLKTRLYLINRQKDRMEEHLDVMTQVTARMHKLVNDLLDISRFENNMIRLDYGTVAIQSLINNLVHIQKPEADKKSITIKINVPDDPLFVRVDVSRIEQVLTNLVINAINYTPDEGNIILKATRTENNRLEVTVQDDGEGIPEELLPNIFKPFIRGKENHEYKGAGLGLSISKEIIDQHGGTISVESKIGEGACFIILLDIAGSDGDGESTTA